MVESSSDEILANAENVEIAFLVVGDPFGYTLFPLPLSSWFPSQIIRIIN
jgi:diphthine synthase